MQLIDYSTDGSGQWWKTEISEQCPHKCLFGECQGIIGHQGVHWNYNKHGSFCYSDNKEDSSENGCSGMIPPDHKNYLTPLEMSQHYYMSHSVCHEVTDPDIIARLEQDNLLDGESVNRPVNDLNPELMKEIINRLKAPCGSNDKPKVEDT